MRIASLVGPSLLLVACSDSSSMTSADAAPDTTSDGAMPDARPVPTHLVAYVSGNAPNITSYDFDLATGALTSVGQVAAFAANPSFLAMTGTHLYAASEGGNKIGAYAIDQATGALTFINSASSGGDGPAHVGIDRAGKFVLAANYGNGMIAVLPVRADGGVNAPTTTRNAGANAHEILADAANKFVFVPCKGANYVAQYTFDATTGALAPNATPTAPSSTAGAGPRHLAFTPSQAFAYVINENLSTLTAYAYDAATGRLAELQTVSNRAAGSTGGNTGAEVVVHPNGKFVYASNRGDNTVSVFAIGGDGKLALVGHVPSGGTTPRSFAIDPTGAWMLVANADSNNVVPFAIDATTGMPAQTGAVITATKPSFVGFVSLP